MLDYKYIPRRERKIRMNLALVYLRLSSFRMIEVGKTPCKIRRIRTRDSR
jgi:hypothetical protein